MQSVEEILAAHGYDDPRDLSYDDVVEVEVGEAMMPLVIEKVGEDRISVAHYYTQMGDLMSDPEIVYRVDGSGGWTPVEYTQHPHVYQRNESGLNDVADFSKTWDRNLREQGYVEAAKNGGEL